MKLINRFIFITICIFLIYTYFNSSVFARTVYDYWTEDGKTNFRIKTSSNPMEYLWYTGAHKSIARVVDKNSVVILTMDKQYWEEKYYIDSAGDLINEYNDKKDYLHPDSVGYDRYYKLINDYKYNVITLKEWPIKSIEKKYIALREVIARERPLLNADKIIIIPQGVIIDGYQESKSWILVYYSGKEGWVLKKSVIEDLPKNNPISTITLSNEAGYSQESTAVVSSELSVIQNLTSPESIITIESH